jgi:hypothetical protein
MSIDFGAVVLNQSSVKTITISNDGLRKGEFSVDVDTSLPLQVNPSKGILESKASATLQVRFDGSKTGKFHEEIKIDFPGGTKTIEVMASVHNQSLELLLPDGKKILDGSHWNFFFFFLFVFFSLTLPHSL